MTLLALLGAPLAGAALAWLARAGRAADGAHLAAAVITALAAGRLALEVWADGAVRLPGWGLAADPLSAFMALLVAGVALVAAVGVPSYLGAEAAAGRLEPARAARFRPLFHIFVFTMLLAVTTDNLGLMWVAVEGTTLASVFLITLERTRASLEAAYKYLLICSVGIAVAFIGTVLVYFADLGQGLAAERALDWSALVAAAPALPRRVVQIAFVFLLIGYGTKAGLAPMHTWLPDAHSEAPAPVSALMSGVLLAVGLYTLLRFRPVVDAAVGPAFASGLLVGFGLASMAVAAAFLWAPRNYKRMLAYSSVEHMGLACLGIAFGGAWGVVGALLHVVNHALAKSSLFVLAGRILQRVGSAEVAHVGGLARLMPGTAAAFLAATLALVGLPPFGLFVSELMILRAGLEGGQAWAAGAALALLVVVFGGVLRAVNRMLYGPPGELAVEPTVEPRGAVPLSPWPLVPITANLVLLVILGLTFPPMLADALARVARVVTHGG
jgi:hydrogenase-4 component F